MNLFVCLKVLPYKRNVDSLRKGGRKRCHRCKSSDSSSLIKCSSCKKKFFCMECIKERFVCFCICSFMWFGRYMFSSLFSFLFAVLFIQLAVWFFCHFTNMNICNSFIIPQVCIICSFELTLFSILASASSWLFRFLLNCTALLVILSSSWEGNCLF